MNHRPLLVLLSLVIVAACSSETSETPGKAAVTLEPADLVLHGGIVISVDPAVPDGESIAVRDHLIEAVGSDAELAEFIGPQTTLIDLAGRTVIPGFIEGHGHFLGLGRARQIIDLSTIRNWGEAVDLVAAAADSAEPGTWIYGRGWHQEKWDQIPADAVDGVPTNRTLNAAAPANPVLLGHASGHAAFANASALKAAGIHADTPDPDGGTIVRDGNGQATGLLRETAQRLVGAASQTAESGRTPAEQDAVLREQVQLAGNEALAFGVTSFQDAGSSFETIAFLKVLEAEGALPVRLYVMVRGHSNEELDEHLPAHLMPAAGNDFLAVRAIKRQVDGALGAHGAWLVEPYIDMPNSTGLVLEPIEDIERTAQIAVKHGFQVNTHAIGTRANREMLNLYEAVWSQAEVDGRKLRWRIEHAQHILPEDVPRFAELGVIAAMQGVHATSDGPWIPARLGETRSRITSYPWRDLLDSGAVIGNGTDVPVEAINPIASYYASVSRQLADGERFHAEQSMTRMEALESYTINNAIAAFEEDLKGTLTPGKLADLVVLSGNLLTVPEDEIPGIRVDITIVGGEVRYLRVL